MWPSQPSREPVLRDVRIASWRRGGIGSPEHGQPSAIGPANSPVRVDGPHHYHHHFHHHYFSSSADLSAAGGGSSRADAGLKDTAKLRASGTGQVMSRNEIAVRKVTHDWPRPAIPSNWMIWSVSMPLTRLCCGQIMLRSAGMLRFVSSSSQFSTPGLAKSNLSRYDRCDGGCRL